MEAIREQLNNSYTPLIASFVVGVILGLVILGWWLFPVQWTDAAPEHLRADLQADYLRMAIESFNLNKDVELAQARYQALGDSGQEVLERVITNPDGLDVTSLTQFANVVQADFSTVEQPIAPESAATPPLPPALLVSCGLLVVLAIALGTAYVIRQQRGGFMRTDSPSMDVEQRSPEVADIGLTSDTPLAQFMTTYMLGDDLFDDSFSVDSPAGEFLGECGVGIAETIGVGEPKRVSSFEVWLFDKNDIQTVTKVMMSAHVFQDLETRERLSAKGEPVLAVPGTQTVLETAKLHLIARVVDMAYGEGALPSESFFDRITLELAVWQKI